jgi:Protein of unknown function (DUF1360)
MSKRNLGLNPVKLVSLERQRFKKRRTGGEWVDGRTEIVQEAGQGQLRRSRTSANRGVGFKDQNGATCPRQRDRRGQTIRSRADYYRIPLVRHTVGVENGGALFPTENAQTREPLRFNCVGSPRSRNRRGSADFSIEKYGEQTGEKEECDEQLLAEYAALLAFYLTSVAVLTRVAAESDRLPRQFSLLDLALLGIATHKLSRTVAKDRITGMIRAPFVKYIRSSGAGEVEEEPRGRGIQRGIGHLISCPYCMAPWCATALAFGFVFAPRVTRFFAGISASVAVSDFLQRAYAAAKEKL